MNTARYRRAARWILLSLLVVGFVLYIGSYIRLRKYHELIHEMSWSGEETFHSIRPGKSGPSLFAAALVTDQIDQLDAIAAAQQRRVEFQMTFYAPARYAEVLFWRMRY
jgi:hypothetical protein